MRMMQSIAAAVAFTAGTAAAVAMPLAPAAPAQPPIVRVAGGCGPGYHRGPYGGCRPGGTVFVEPRVAEPHVVAPVRLPPPCPRGYYRDPRPGVQLCYPRF